MFARELSILAILIGLLGQFGCGKNHTNHKAVSPPEARPTADFTVSVIGREAHFTDESTDSGGEISSWNWAFGDDSSSTDQNPVHLYASTGAFVVTLTVADNDSNLGTHADTIHIAGLPPVGAFSFMVAGRGVAFTDKSTDPDGAIVAWDWSFGDGATSALQNPTHGYANVGRYGVSLMVTDNDGDTAQVTDTVTTVNLFPTASFQYSVTGQELRFTDDSVDPDGNIVVWNWRFGDGETSSQRNPQHIYTAAGDYTVMLIVTDDLGAADTSSQIISLADRHPPIASFSVSLVGREAHFKDESIDDGTIAKWHWRFGDDLEDSIQNPVHRYEYEGSYAVVLTVTDNENNESSYSHDLDIVNYSPVAAFADSVEGRVVTFSDQSSDDGVIVAWSWSFGDGSSSTVQNPVHLYVSTGDFVVTLTVADNDSNLGTHTDTVQIEGKPPVAAFSFVATGRDVAFVDASTDPDGSVVAWSWRFGDGVTSVLQNPTHNYAGVGRYGVSLTVTDNDGDTARVVDTVTTVNLSPAASFHYSVTGQRVQFTDNSTDPDGSIAAWSWRFGDGGTSSQRNPQHDYTVAGDYTVTLIVADDLGATGTSSQVISLAFDYVVYNDSGTAGGSDVWTWSGAEWGGPPGTFEGKYPDATAPEGKESFLTKSGSDWSGKTNYAGWGVFLTKPSDHTVNLSAYTVLRFWVKSSENLKIELQRDSRNGAKPVVWLSSFGWDGTNRWQEISVPKTAFASGSLPSVFGVFMATAVKGSTTFYIDRVRWVR